MIWEEGYKMNIDQDEDDLVKETEMTKKYGIKTYGDYITWNDEQRYEIIEGKVYSMSPAPDRLHQQVSVEILGQFYNYLADKKCEIYSAPFDVRLPEGNESDQDIKTVVQPDLAVICDLDKLDKRGCRGAPDLIIEIISPSTEKKDKNIKKRLYEKHGVREYWLVDYNENHVQVYRLSEDNGYGKPELYTQKQLLPVNIFNGDLKVNLVLVFQE